MANPNGPTKRDETIEHGYQDWRDQHDRAHGRDDFRGLDRDTSSDRGSGVSPERGAIGTDYQPGSGYGYDDGNPGVEPTSYRGQSGSQAGGTVGNRNANGGNPGHWGDFDRGGRSSRRPKDEDKS